MEDEPSSTDILPDLKQTVLLKKDEISITKVFLLSFDAQCTKRALMQIVDSIGPDQHAHSCSLIQAFYDCQYILQYPLIL